jgi:hypothetical protein
VPTPLKPGPPQTEIDLAQVETAASIGCTLEEIAAIVKISKRTLIRRRKDPRFLEALERGQAKGRASLRKMQWDSAKAGNVTAQIWLGKQLLGQRSFEREEKPDVGAVTIPPLIIETYDPEADAVTPVDAAEPGVPEPGALPRPGSGS